MRRLRVLFIGLVLFLVWTNLAGVDVQCLHQTWKASFEGAIEINRLHPPDHLWRYGRICSVERSYLDGDFKTYLPNLH